MAGNVSRTPDVFTSDTDLNISYLWRLLGEDAFLLCSDAPEFEGRMSAHAYLALTHLPLADGNFAVVTGGSDAEARLRESHHIIATAGLPAVLALAGAVAEHLRPIAEQLGLTAAGNSPFMAYQARHAPLPSQDYAVEMVIDAAGLRAARDLGTRALGWPDDLARRMFGPTMLDVPGFAYFLARRDGEPRSSVMTFRHGAYVGIYSMATPPEYQRQGAGRALLEHVIADFMGRGARTFYLLATEQGYPLYERMGFTTVDWPAIWLAGESNQFS